MRSFWQLEARDIENLRGGDGEAFSQFVVSLIRAQARVAGIPASAIHAGSRPMGDDGIDCQVDLPSERDPSGRLRMKAIWQFKAQRKAGLLNKLKNELKNRLVVERLQEGYAYRCCIADDLAAPQAAEGGQWVGTLRDEARRLAGCEVDVQVLGSTALADWGSAFPALGLRLRSSALPLMDLKTWGENITDPTPKYVENPDWAPTRARILAHCDFSKDVPEAVEVLQGAAGVGKTRLAFETISALPDADGSVVYTQDEGAALELALDLARDTRTTAILVADECSLAKRFKIGEALRGHRSRIRVLAIDNQGEQLRGPENQASFLRRLPENVVEKVLNANFTTVPGPQRRFAVEMAGGFLRIAIWICGEPPGPTSTAPNPNLRNYYELRVPGEDRKIVEAISLVTRVGWAGEISQEWTDLCALCRIHPDDGRERARRLKDVPGFVGIGGRYFYVTPEAIAEIAIEQAYGNWIAHDPPSFFDRLPPSIEEAFLRRVARSSCESLRKAVADYSEGWGGALTSADLADKKKTERLVRLAEVNPERFLPTLRRLLEQATKETLLHLDGGATTGWGARRNLVWLCERAAAFPEFFHDAEHILFLLALHETEEGVGNNATEIWSQLHQLFLPGTSVPYLARLELLRRRLHTGDVQQALMVLSALKRTFDEHSARGGTPPLFGGRIRPDDWSPATSQEVRRCTEGALDVVREALGHADATIQNAALDLVVRKLQFILEHGYLDWGKRLLNGKLPFSRLAVTVETIDLVLGLRARGVGSPLPDEYVAALREWRESLVPKDLHAQLVRDVGRNLYRAFDDSIDAEWRGRIGNHATELIVDPKKLDAELPWLVSEEAKSSSALGEELASRDAAATLLDPILTASVHASDGLACGYVQRLLQRYPEHSGTVNTRLDRLEVEAPLFAVKLSSLAPEQTSHYERVLRMFDAGRLPVTVLGALRHSLGSDDRAEDRLVQVLTRLFGSGRTPTRDGYTTALSLCFSWLRAAANAGRRLQIKPELKRCLRRLLTGFSPRDPSHSHEWSELLRLYGQLEPEAAIQIACKRIDRWDDYERKAFLHEQARHHPRVVMDALGRVLLDKEHGWKLRMRGVGGLLGGLPVEVVLKWLEVHGVAGARVLASSLPRPFVDRDDVPRVPRLTEEVLRRFGGDAETQDAFLLGSGVRSYTGDIPSQYEEESRNAAAFLTHPLPAIRAWAHTTKARREQDAKQTRAEEAERLIPA